MKSNQAGFTIVEMISVIAVSGLFVGLILYFGISYWRYSALLESDLDTFVSRLNAQDVVRELIGSSSGLINQNSIVDVNANNPDPVAGSNFWQELHAVPGNLSAAPNTTTPVLYFRKNSVRTNNTVAMNGTQPYEDEYVLYIDGSSRELRMRILANPNVTSNKVKTSCPPAVSTPSCPADRVVLENLDSLGVTYYSRSGNTVDFQSIYDPDIGEYAGPDFPVVEAVQYTFRITKKTLFQKTISTQNDTVVRIALRST